MAVGARNCKRVSARVIMVLAALALLTGLGAPGSVMAQVRAPAKAKLKVLPKADPSDNVADQLNAQWREQNAAFSGFTSAPAKVVPASAAIPANATPASGNEWGDRLVSRAMTYLGTPYRPGGISPKTGFDCSGFVYYLYGAVFGQTIPRMPDGMAREGTTITRSDLKPGDIVFFGFGRTFTHVGIYAGNDQFVHATHRGSPVSLTSLDADYYRQHYMTAVRLTPQ